MQCFGLWLKKVFVVLKFAVAFTVVIDGFKEVSKQIYNPLHCHRGELAASFNQPCWVLCSQCWWCSRASWVPGHRCHGCSWGAGPAAGRGGHRGTGHLGMMLGSHGCFVAMQHLLSLVARGSWPLTVSCTQFTHWAWHSVVWNILWPVWVTCPDRAPSQLLVHLLRGRWNWKLLVLKQTKIRNN